MGQEFAGSRAPLVCALMDCSVLSLIPVDVNIVEQLTTSTMWICTVCVQSVYKADCVKYTEAPRMIFFFFLLLFPDPCLML